MTARHLAVPARAAVPARPRGYRGATGVSACFGTFGELVQGVLPGAGGDFLVTLPIARWTVATFQLDPGAGGVQVHPRHKVKAQRITEMLLELLGGPAGGVLTIESSLPEGKGLASSSADLVAAARAVGNALGADLPPDRIEHLLRQIEPTDGVLYPGIVAFDHRAVRLRTHLGSLPTMTIIGLDEGGMVDTIAFNQLDRPFSAADRREYRVLLERMADAVARRDLATAGAIATRSAELNQTLSPKRTLAAVLDICRDIGALGVVATHSGTMLGLLLDVHDPDYLAKVAAGIHGCARLSDDVALYRSLTFD
ncbi:MAG: kinase [Actinobacteria bacterium]|nr:kinase [Actinomycetota bacterium]